MPQLMTAEPPPRSGRASTSFASSATTVCLSLISHTNVGKTTLARTLLRRDVGQVLDQEHVTVVAEAHCMVEAEGCRLLLWDTPGFGNTAPLLKRLRRSHQPVRAFLLETWDRVRNRSLWCSQQAVRNVQADADVVLYLIDASQKPEDAAFVGMEMEILQWMGKPVVVLLNQTGPPRPRLDEQIEEEGWRQHLRRFSIVREVLGLDAFARCWVQEHVLLDRIGPLVPTDKRAAFLQLKEAWQRKNALIFEQSMAVLGRQLAESVTDKETTSKETLLQRIGWGRRALHDEMDAAREALGQRLAERSVAASNELIHLHELAGQRKEHLEKAHEKNFSVPQAVNESLWTAVGGVLTGAATGVLTDIKTGGLTLGGGAIVGAFLGGAGSYLLAKGYNLTRSAKDSVRWTEEHFAAQTETVLLFYLAVAHWGRGRGEWAEADHPAAWRETVATAVSAHRKEIDALWKRGPEGSMEELASTAAALCRRLANDLLGALFPQNVPDHTVSVVDSPSPPLEPHDSADP